MARLILHSDDFGLHEEVNRAVITAAEKGALTSASVMMNGAAVDDAVEKARSCPSLGVGLHLNVVRGRPLSDPGEVPSLVDAKGGFFNSMGTLLWRSLRGALSADDIHREYRKQLSRMREFGLTPSHFDGEKHSHLLLPEATEAVRRLADEFGIHKLRLIGEAGLNRTLKSRRVPLSGPLAQRAKLRLLEVRSRRARKVLRHLTSTEATFGVILSGAESLEAGYDVLRTILDLDSPRTVEWMFHLSYPCSLDVPEFKAEFGSFFLDDSRARELEFLCSDRVRQELERSRGKLISYREL